ncbi:hypothetical protein O181_105808 [Austropuccinia psidii MF-1]|uniref:Uncharacterized protein n=1 Tax=Austropuccinia psidii MF-1 TaxID=1389203 RepID=A0A9Q3JMR9_9BASI|nr:hypothetical protein [Austropuccinia psidii MF-1]
MNKGEIKIAEVRYKPNLEEKTMATKKKQYESNFKEELATNTAYRRTVKTFISDPDISTNANTITTNKNPKTKKRTMKNNNRPFSSNQPDTNNNEIYSIKEEKSRPTTSRASSRINKIDLATIDTTINKNKEETIDVTDTENNEIRILNKIKDYIEKKKNDQPITTKIQIS